MTYTYAISPLAVVIGALTLDEPVTLWLGLGGVLVVGGIALAQRGTRNRAAAGTADLDTSTLTRQGESPAA